jgi:hypothetical protein
MKKKNENAKYEMDPRFYKLVPAHLDEDGKMIPWEKCALTGDSPLVPRHFKRVKKPAKN